MESIVSYFSSLGLDFWSLMAASGVLLLGALLFSGLLRFIFGKKTLVGNAISSSIAIVFIYVVMALILTLLPQMHWIVTPLPFVSFTQDAAHFFSFRDAVYTTVASQLLSMVILSFLVNLADSWMPKGKHILGWIFWRCVTVALGLLLHFAVTWLFHRYLPIGIVIYAPVILLAILLIMLLTGVLRLVVGAILTTVNPLMAALYTFFFANIVGKQLTKAVLTTGLLVGVVYLMQYLDITALSLAAGALIAYIPFLLLLVLVWYVVSRFL